ncbi:MAG: hypothetical protein AB1499_00585 [Nitrospirota bacterium]
MKKNLIIFGIIAAILIGALVLFLTSLDRIVAAAIEHYGSETTQTGVDVSSVRIKLKSGEGSVRSLKISNPSGFSSPNVFVLEDISVKIDPASVTKDVIIIDRVLVSRPHVTYEINESGRANINAINENVKRSQGKGTKEKQKDKSGVKLLIRRLEISDGQINVRTPVMKEPMVVKMQRIELTNLGKGGAPPGDIASDIILELVKEAGLAVAQAGVEKYLGKGIDEMKGQLQKQIGSEAGEAVEGLAEQAGEEMKKLLGR